MIPNSTPRATQSDVVSALIQSGLWSDTTISRLSLVGIRGYYFRTLGDSTKNDRGIYDDAIFLISPDTFTSFNANTDPSIYRTGRAVLEAPQRVVYKCGHHGYGRSTGHPAFRQDSTVIVKRDGKKGNGRHLGNGRFRDSKSNRFWINLHRGGHSSTSSAGCQTIPPTQWAAFYNLVRLQLARFSQGRFSYYLINGPIN